MAFSFATRPSRRLILAALGASTMMSGGFGRAEEGRRSPLRLAMASTAPPFSWQEMTSGGIEVVRGIVPETLRKAFEIEGTHAVTFGAFPWARAQRLVEEGEFDGFCTNATLEREHYALFGTEPVTVNEFAIFTSAAHPRLAEMNRISRPEDLMAFRQADFMGNGFAESLFAGFRDKILWQRELETVFRLIANGRADLAYVNETTGRHVLERMGLMARFTILPIRLSPPSAYRLGLRRTYPGALSLVTRIDQVIRDMRRDGALDFIVARQF